VQEESSLLRIPAVTCRTTERIETVECGSNVLSGVRDPKSILHCVRTTCDDTLNLRLWEAAGYETPPTVPEMVAELAGVGAGVAPGA
jgi:UDP-N-acetylglucosamine 2-epimerase (non-hydrolysing)